MATNQFSGQIDRLFQQNNWSKARTLLERERAKDPRNHWLLTQLGVTFYEEHNYNDALRVLQESRGIVPDCPLTLWNLAGTLDALGKQRDAVEIYSWLLSRRVSASADPCWESKAWADKLKADCIYRLGVCFQHLGESKNAEKCFRQYGRLLCAGAGGTYTLKDLRRRFVELPPAASDRAMELARAIRGVSGVLNSAGAKGVNVHRAPRADGK